MNKVISGRVSPKRAAKAWVPASELREYIRLLDARGDLMHVPEAVHWQCELGRRTRVAGRPILFENIIDHPGQRVFSNGLWSPGAIRLALGFEADLPEEVFLEEIVRRIGQPIAPTLVERGPVLENMVEGDALNLFDLPIPQWHERDAGRYLGTWHLNVTRDPETGARNLGVYRMQMLGQQHATVSASSRSDLGRHLAHAESTGQALPMTVVIGAVEPLIIAAAAAYPAGMDEYELAGGLMQRPVELLRSEHGSLEIPAHAEIAIEGVIQPGVRARDGAYMDYTGRAETNTHAFLFEAKRLLFRNDPIFRGASIGLAGAEDHQVFAFLASLNLVDFHGSRPRRFLQNLLLRKRYFSLLQRMDRINRDGLRQFLHRTGSR